MPNRGVVRFGKRGKLSLRFIGSFEILERVGTVAYRLALPPSLSSVYEVFHVSILRKYTPDPTHVGDWGELIVDTYGTFEEEPMCIMDSRYQVLRRKTVRIVKVLWQHRGVEEATWEREDTMCANYLFLFKDDDTLFSHFVVMIDSCACDCVYMCVNFRDEILLGGEECENPSKFKNFRKTINYLIV